MKSRQLILFLLLIFTFVASCKSKKTEDDQVEKDTDEYASGYLYSGEYGYDSGYSDSYDTYYYGNDNRIEDGTYSATVDYYNPDTEFSNTYTLDVVVSDGQVVEIDFPNGGYLDDSHITPADIDEDGCCTVYGEDGKTFEITIDL